MSTSCLRPFCSLWCADHTLTREPFDRGLSVDPDEPGDRHTSICHHNIVSLTSTIKPIAKVSPQFSDRNVHGQSVQYLAIQMYVAAVEVCAATTSGGTFDSCIPLLPTVRLRISHSNHPDLPRCISRASKKWSLLHVSCRKPL